MKYLLLLSLLLVSSAKAQQITPESCKEAHTVISGSQETKNNEPQLFAYLLTIQAQCYLSGVHVQKNFQKAKKALKESIELGNSKASHILASANVFFSNDPNDWRAGLAVLEQEYQKGSYYSAGKIGWAHNIGRGTSKDGEKALHFYRIAASGGMTLWQYLLAHSYEQGYYGLEIDSEKTQYWKDYQPKVHTYDYDCAIHHLYSSGRSFPENKEVELEFKNRCESSVNKLKQ